MQIYSKTDKGLVRDTNQDVFFAAELENDVAFAMVCDGMGGANAGNVASETAVKTISDYIIHSYRPKMDEFAIEKLLKNAIESANIEIYDKALKNAELFGMGTTVVLTVIRGEKAIIAHVGDSRAYKISESITQLTRDHSVVQSLLESGKITEEASKVHPRKNVITRALGAEESVIPDISTVSFLKGEKILLCSDGLSSMLSKEKILDIIKSSKEDVAEKLVSAANDMGGRDNITVVLLVG